MSRLLSQKMRPLSTHPLLCVYAKCGDILHTTSFNTLMGLSCYCDALGYDLDIEMCQCPLGLIPHFYETSISKKAKEAFVVSMPSRAYTSFLRYPFKNLDFMRFPEPVFAGIYQNILATAVFRAC